MLLPWKMLLTKLTKPRIEKNFSCSTSHKTLYFNKDMVSENCWKLYRISKQAPVILLKIYSLFPSDWTGKKVINQETWKNIFFLIFSWCSCTIHYVYMIKFIYTETSSNNILNVWSVSKMLSKVLVITTFYIFWSLNQGGRPIVKTEHLANIFCIL